MNTIKGLAELLQKVVDSQTKAEWMEAVEEVANYCEDDPQTLLDDAKALLAKAKTP